MGTKKLEKSQFSVNLSKETWDCDGRPDPLTNPASHLFPVFGVAMFSRRQNLDPLRADQVLVEYRPSVGSVSAECRQSGLASMA